MTTEQSKNTVVSTMTMEQVKAKQELDAKPFNELNDTQKIDRLVEHVMSQHQTIGYLSRSIQKLEKQVRTLKKHKHTSTGEVVVDIEVADQDNYGSDSLMRKMPTLM